MMIEGLRTEEIKSRHNISFYVKSIIMPVAEQAKVLLEEKGFENTANLIDEKYVLLSSEISELMDAYKKNQGVEAQKEEIADIIIRLMNFPIMFEWNEEFYNEFVEKHSTKELDSKMTNERTLLEPLNDNSLAFSTLAAMHKEVRTLTGILEDIIRMKYGCEKAKSQNLMTEYYENRLLKRIENYNNIALSYCISIICQCELYLREVLNIKDPYALVPIIADKMEKNMKRPFRYNAEGMYGNKGE